jgi:hypothetical protein
MNFDTDWASAFTADRVSDEHLFARNFVSTPAHEALDGIDRFRGFQYANAIGLVPHHRLGVRTWKMNHGRRQPLAFAIGQYQRNPRIHHCHQRVSRAEIDADDFAHHFPAGADAAGSVAGFAGFFAGVGVALKPIW